MDYWKGYMDWPIDIDWKCEICGEYKGLTWGLVHAQCRCNVCHVQYRMRDKDSKVVTKPICQLKPEYYEPIKELWQEFQQPIDEFTDDQWQKVFTKKD